MLLYNQIKHVRQTTNDNCVAACISMVTGISIEDVEASLTEDGFEQPYETRGMVRLLARENVFAEPVQCATITPFISGSVYLGLSITRSNGCHMCVLLVHVDGSVQVLDPSDDLSRLRSYSLDDFYGFHRLEDCSVDYWDRAKDLPNP